MTTDIDKIKYELNGFEEVKLPYTFNKNDIIKYITLKNDNELFYTGGKFIQYGNECIFVENANKKWCFKTKIRDDDNNIIYTSRIFIKKDECIIDNKKIKELNEIIKAQQTLIDKMSIKIKILERKVK